jgi:hypothetical protein
VHIATTPALRGGATETLAWNGRDGDGRPVARGAYLVRVTWDGRAATARLLVLQRP